MKFSCSFQQQIKPSIFAALHKNKPNVMLQHPDNPAWTWGGNGSKLRWLKVWEHDHQSWDALCLVSSPGESGGNAKAKSVAS